MNTALIYPILIILKSNVGLMLVQCLQNITHFRPDHVIIITCILGFFANSSSEHTTTRPNAIPTPMPYHGILLSAEENK